MELIFRWLRHRQCGSSTGNVSELGWSRGEGLGVDPASAGGSGQLVPVITQVSWMTFLSRAAEPVTMSHGRDTTCHAVTVRAPLRRATSSA